MNDLFKVGEFFLNYFIGRGNILGEKSLEISAEILNQMRRILILVVMTLGSLTLFCLGMNFLIERFLNNLDHGETLLTPSIWVILVFQLICVGIMVYATNKNKWLDIFKAEKKEVAERAMLPGGNQLESVLSLLVLDFIKEREAKRAKQQLHAHSDKNE